MTKQDFWKKKKERKKIDGPNLGQMDKIGPKTKFFCHLLKFSSLVFLEIAYDDSLQQWLTSSRGKIHKKKQLGAQI